MAAKQNTIIGDCFYLVLFQFILKGINEKRQKACFGWLHAWQEIKKGRAVGLYQNTINENRTSGGAKSK